MTDTPGDDDDIIIKRVNNADQTDTKTPVETTKTLFSNLLGYIAPNTIADQPTKALYNALVSIAS